ncbi:MAG TPA: HRDC domain-containing protein [Isosphaeraceae bacterium]|nr:HRDC domain-containing protein [Isosphaeraceae bacterium]
MIHPDRDQWIETPAELDDLLDHLQTSGRFALDTEFVSEDTYEPVLGLIQVATTERIAAVDPIAIGDLSEFWNLVTGPDVEVVMHAAGEDLRICRFRSGRLPERVVDVQIAAGLIGFNYPLSHGNLVNQVLGVTVSGGETRTDWRRRPLSDAQVRYALDDVRFLLDVSNHLNRRLDELGRLSWADEEYATLKEAVESRDESERWRRLSGIHHLNRRSLEIARRLWLWRLEEANRSNRPIRQIMRDDLIIGIAKRQPASRRDLEALRDFHRPHLMSKANALVALIQEALDTPTDQLPEASERPDTWPGESMVVSLLSAALHQSCTQNALAPSLVGSVGDLKELIRWHLAGQPAETTPSLASRWRGEVCGRDLLDVLSGRRSVRIVDPTADVPIVLDPISREP